MILKVYVLTLLFSAVIVMGTMFSPTASGTLNEKSRTLAVFCTFTELPTLTAEVRLALRPVMAASETAPST
jgi:hypothetical protein